MGIKGWLGFHLKEKKISHKLFHSLMASVVKEYLEDSGNNIEEVNQRLFDLGFKMAEPLLFEYADKIKEHASKFEEFKDTLNLAYKVFTGVEFDEVRYDPERETITYKIKDCPICSGLRLPDELKGLKYCNVVSGIFTAVLKLRGFDGTCTEVECAASGGEACVYEMYKSGV